MSDAQAAASTPPEQNTQSQAADDYIPLHEYFSEMFIPESGIDLPIKDEHKEINDVIEAAYLGDIAEQFVCINMPPRTGKTKIVQSAISWGEGYYNDSQNILTSYADNLATESLAYVRKTFNEPWYKEWFGDFIHGETNDHLSTIAGGNIYAEGVGGSLLGRGAGLKRPAGGAIWIDDPAKPNQALSPKVASNLEQWFEMTLKSRRNSDRFCPIIVVCQRLGLSDLVEYLKRHYRKETLILKFPCYVDRHSRFPETWADSGLEIAERTRIGRFALSGMMQQEPVSLGGNLIQTDKFYRYAPGDRQLSWDDKILTCDTAIKKGEGNDFYVIQAWARSNQKCYLLDQLRGQWSSPEFIRMAIVFYRKHYAMQQHFPVSRFIIEEAGSGVGIIQALNEAGIPATGIIRTKDKVARVNDVLVYVETGMVLLPRDDDPEATWLPEFLAEAAAFSPDMSHEHDDQIDAFSDGISQLLGEGLSILQVLGISPGQGGS